MFCAKCGCQIGEDVKFCGKCGAETGRGSGAAPAGSSAVPAVPPVSSFAVPPMTIPAAPPLGGRKKKKGSPAVVIMGVIVAALLTSGLVFMATGGMSKVHAMQQLSLGNRYLEDLDYEGAIAAFQAVIEIEPKEERAYIGLAEAYMGLGDPDAAVEVLAQGIEETGSDRLRDYQEEIEDSQRRFVGCVYAVDTDLDDTNNVAISNVSVNLTDSAGNTVTVRADETGWYESDLVPKGVYTIRYRVDDYVEYVEEVRLTGGKYELDVYLEPDARTTLYGSVQIADSDTDYSNNLPLEGVSVTLTKLTGSNAYSAECQTDARGQYVIPDLLMGVYNVKLSREGYLPAEQTLIVYGGQSVTYSTVVEAVGTQWAGKGTASGMVYDALTGAGVPGLTMLIRRGINNTDGEVLASFETDENGRYQTPGLDSGNYSIEIVDGRTEAAEKFLGMVMGIKILGGMDIGNQDGTVSTAIQTGQVRIVLTWGEQPADLDSHLECSLARGDKFHIYFEQKTFLLSGERIADLDLDDTQSYGPETTTIYRADEGEYLFWVHNYTGSSQYGLANSGACVQVYMGYSSAPSYVFYVPNEAGYGWEVFRYNSATGVLTPSNKMYADYYW